MKKNVHGITLIILVITIVVLIILAGVSISMLTGQNGIITQAQRAKEETEKAEIEEKRQLARYQASMNSTASNYMDVKIPVGFALTGINGEASIEEGLVITDDIGNEYVWIEVPKKITSDCNSDEEIEEKLKEYASPYTKGSDSQEYQWKDEWYAIENGEVITKDTERLNRRTKNVRQWLWGFIL